jgi:DNA-binding MarR family transcriptional regulator
MNYDAEKRRKQEKYFAEICFFMKVKDNLLPNDRKALFNRTELRLLSEVVAAQYEGERVISTQLAKRIGVTRSAVSQMVANLEEKGVLRRVASPVDKKIAYVEVAEEALETYGEELSEALAFLGDVVEEFGEDNFAQMCKLFREFVGIMEKRAKK